MGMDAVPTGVLATAAGSLLGTATVNAVPAAGSLVIAAGVYAMYTVGANVSYQIFDSTGAWTNVSAVGVGGIIYSDGVNFRFNNTAAGIQNVTTSKIG